MNSAIGVCRKKIMLLGATEGESAIILGEINKIHKQLISGASLTDTLIDDDYTDPIMRGLALLTYTEAIFAAEFKNAAEWQKRCAFNKKYSAWVKRSFTIACEARYYRGLRIILNNNGTYRDLIKLNPAAYHLPACWRGLSEKATRPDDLIPMVLSSYIDEAIYTHPDESVESIIRKLKIPIDALRKIRCF